MIPLKASFPLSTPPDAPFCFPGEVKPRFLLTFLFFSHRVSSHSFQKAEISPLDLGDISVYSWLRHVYTSSRFPVPFSDFFSSFSPPLPREGPLPLKGPSYPSLPASFFFLHRNFFVFPWNVSMFVVPTRFFFPFSVEGVVLRFVNGCFFLCAIFFFFWPLWSSEQSLRLLFSN